ncbi:MULTISPECIES: helix-hairpin-helix domain-containing protein [Selenomonas]|uniref:Competence protein ComEA n=2 Tax=Selenomonas TaxID=970 RepID=A0A5D6VXB2_9FIRM|nr:MULTISPECIES: helix-hairpin-helix domain-containing protein [unclassified Selenomonas]MBQ1867698.1 helix-hairpin-helix domain-containing protein [Selenomonas sp.]TYZ19325.1 competence protein ComEA [Selenomonas sp. mPRGC5]
MPMYKKSLGILLLLLVAIAVGTVYGSYAQESAVVLDEAGREETSQGKNITVYVTGAVNNPGMVTVKEGARVGDVVNSCGGLLPTADQQHINMAQVVKDGEQVKVPERQASPAQGNGQKNGKQASEKGGLVNINTADEKELDSLPGIGPAMAKRIIEYRETEGSFQRIEDIKKIKGIGEAKFAKIRDKICL